MFFVQTQLFGSDRQTGECDGFSEELLMRKLSGMLLATAMVTMMGVSSAKADEAATASATAEKTIVEVAVEGKIFNTLVAAVKAGGLVETLSGEGPFTVFAPTDEAFAALPEGTVEMLVKPENKDKLVKILTYHVVSGKVMAKDVVTLSEAKTVQGSMVDIEVKDGTVMIDKAKVIKPDVDCKNGVIHVIDKVLMPE
ncbi:Immunogenic protein MPT70 precursor [Rubripirellula obstinata]|uniref:Immunogenic protein MPT70 n=2 Tax=Rubripirellula obstinata TaxID=406547 RepID=A0A5B1CJS7_9BACT|nr:Immunogenic protein MPT70 precursor [Rubripirellula obstinata]